MSGFPTVIKDSDGNDVVFATVNPTFPAFGDGSPINSVLTSGSGSTIGDILWSIDTTGVSAIAYHWPVPGTSAICAIEGTYDGTAWFGVIAYRMGSAGINFQSITTLSGRYASAVNGCLAMRCRLTAAGSGGAVTGSVRSLSNPLSATAMQQQISTSVLTSSTAIGSPVQISSSLTNLSTISLLNTQTSHRYIHFFNSVTGTGTAVAIFGIPANEQFNTALPGRGIPFGTALSYKVTTDSAGTTGATAGDVIGTVGYGQ